MSNKNENKAKKSGKSTLALIQEILGVIGGIVGSIMVIYGFIKTFRDDAGGFTWLLFVGSAIWLIILWRMFYRQKTYAYMFLAVTIVGAVAGWIGWHSQVEAEENKLIVLIAEFDGPEDVYGLRNEIVENLNTDFGKTKEVEILTIKEIITPESDSGSSRARELGEKHRADIVIWGWYRPTENPNVTIHIESLSTHLDPALDPSSTFQPAVTVADLESFAFQQKLGSETTALINFLTGMIQYQNKQYSVALLLFNKSLS